MATKKFPDVLYVKRENEGTEHEEFLNTAEDVGAHAEFDTTVDVAVYRLEQVGKLTTKVELVVVGEAPPAAKRATKKPTAPALAAAPTQTIPAEIVAPVPAAAPAVPVTKEKAQAVLEDVFAAKGIEAARDLLKHFKVKRLQDLSADRFPEFIEKAKLVVAGGDTL